MSLLDLITRRNTASLLAVLLALGASGCSGLLGLLPEPVHVDRIRTAAEQEYRQLVDSALVNHHVRSLETLVATAEAESLSEEEFGAWLDAVGSLRLVLGTRLDVHEDMDAPDPQDPQAAEYSLYVFLGELQELMVQILAEVLPDEGRPEGAL